MGERQIHRQLHHHNIFYDPGEDKFCLFGGYGAYSYHNSFLQYNDLLDRWESVKFTGSSTTIIYSTIPERINSVSSAATAPIAITTVSSSTTICSTDGRASNSPAAPPP